MAAEVHGEEAGAGAGWAATRAITPSHVPLKLSRPWTRTTRGGGVEPDERPGWNTWRTGRARRETPANDAEAATATAEDMLGRE